jgi:hypothetical protein
MKTDKPARLCANSSPRYPCSRPPLQGHIFCDACRRECGGMDLRHRPYVGDKKRNRGIAA